MMWTLVITSLALAAAPQVEARTLAGHKEAGTLTSLSADGVTLEREGNSVTLAARDLLSIKPVQAPTAASADKPSVWIELIDGSQLQAKRYTVARSVASAALVGGEAVEIPTRSIRHVRLQSHESPLAQQSQLPRQWQEITGGQPTGDVIVIRKLSTDGDDEPTSAALDQLEGIVEEITDDKVHFTFDDQKIPVDRGKVEGVIYFHPSGRELPQPLCRVDDVAGSAWNVKSLALSLDDGLLQLTSVAGVKALLPLDRLKAIDYSSGKIVYLSDLEPETSQWSSPFGKTAAQANLARLFAPRRDMAFDGGPIVIGGQSHEKGLAVRSRTLLEYRLAGKFNKLLAVAALDDSVGLRGHVKLVVSLDGKVLGEHQIAAGAEPAELNYDIRGGRKLSILVDVGQGLDIGDRLYLGSARVTQ